MEQNSQEQKKRWVELARRAYDRGCYTYTEFLSPMEQSELLSLPPAALASPCRLWGGTEQAERKIACFGSLELCGYEEEAPLAYLEIAPLSPRFADPLGHRDFLGALLSLGLRRQALGDILLQENRACLICLAHMAPFIQEQLVQVKHTLVRCCSLDAPPETLLALPDPTPILAASPRLDVLVAAVYHLSRSQSQQLIAQGRVAVNDRECLSADLNLTEGARVSVRGYGRFFYEAAEGNTRKGRLRLLVRIF